MEHSGQGGVVGDAVVLKICHKAPGGCHCTHPGVSCGSVADVFSFESVLLSSEEDTDKGGRSAFMWGGGGGWGWMGANVELDVPEPERCGDCVRASLAALVRS